VFSNDHNAVDGSGDRLQSGNPRAQLVPIARVRASAPGVETSDVLVWFQVKGVSSDSLAADDPGADGVCGLLSGGRGVGNFKVRE